LRERERERERRDFGSKDNKTKVMNTGVKRLDKLILLIDSITE